MLGGAFIGLNVFQKAGSDSLLKEIRSTPTRPKTYFLQEAVNLGLSSIAHRLDRADNFRPYFEIHLKPSPHLEHQIWDLGDMCSRFTDAYILGRQMTCLLYTSDAADE